MTLKIPGALPEVKVTAKRPSALPWILAIAGVAAGAYYLSKENNRQKVSKVFNDHFRRTRKK
jgi:hypothetical protein